MARRVLLAFDISVHRLACSDRKQGIAKHWTFDRVFAAKLGVYYYITVFFFL